MFHDLWRNIEDFPNFTTFVLPWSTSTKNSRCFYVTGSTSQATFASRGLHQWFQLTVANSAQEHWCGGGRRWKALERDKASDYIGLGDEPTILPRLQRPSIHALVCFGVFLGGERFALQEKLLHTWTRAG